VFALILLLSITHVMIPVRKLASQTTVPSMDFVPTDGVFIDAPLTYLDMLKIPSAVPIALRMKHMVIPRYPSILIGEKMSDRIARNSVTASTFCIVYLPCFHFETDLLF